MTFVIPFGLWQNNSHLVLIQSNLPEFIYLILLLERKKKEVQSLCQIRSNHAAKSQV